MIRETIRFTLASWAAVVCCGVVLFWALPSHSAGGNGNGNGNVGNFNGNSNSGNGNGNGNLGDGYGNWNTGNGNGNGPAWKMPDGKSPDLKRLSTQAPFSPDVDELLQLQLLWALQMPPHPVQVVPVAPADEQLWAIPGAIPDEGTMPRFK